MTGLSCERVNDAHEEAVKYGTTVELALLRAQWMYVNEILDRFPDVGLPSALRERKGVAHVTDATTPSKPENLERPRKKTPHPCPTHRLL
jgi:glycerol dehydrogenase-like iron-containing ADH family enzyme